MTEFSKSSELDSRYFGHYVNKHKHYKTSTNPLQLDEHAILIEENKVCKAWKDYFCKVYMPVNHAHYDLPLCFPHRC